MVAAGVPKVVFSRNNVRRKSEGSSVVTIAVVVLVIAGVLGWALYDSQNQITVRQVPTENIAVPTSPAPNG
jgi:hypothetical protein